MLGSTIVIYFDSVFQLLSGLTMILMIITIAHYFRINKKQKSKLEEIELMLKRIKNLQ